MPWDALMSALAAAWSPTTLVIVAALLSRKRPLRLAFTFLAAAGAITLAVGFALVGVSSASGLDDKHHHPTVPPSLDVILGATALLFALMVARRPPRPPKVRKDDTRVSTAVLLGVAMGSPSPLYLLALHTVSQSGESTAVKYLDVVVLAVIVQLMAEVPIITYLMAPQRTAAALAEANGWLARHGHAIVVLLSAGVGGYFIVKGIVGLS
jgi:hypothetical protein